MKTNKTDDEKTRNDISNDFIVANPSFSGLVSDHFLRRRRANEMQTNEKKKLISSQRDRQDNLFCFPRGAKKWNNFENIRNSQIDSHKEENRKATRMPLHLFAQKQSEIRIPRILFIRFQSSVAAIEMRKDNLAFLRMKSDVVTLKMTTWLQYPEFS